MGTRSPSSLRSPGPAARILPSCGFSLAVSGRIIPPAVISSCSVGSTITRPPRGFSFSLPAILRLRRWRKCRHLLADLRLYLRRYRGAHWIPPLLQRLADKFSLLDDLEDGIPAVHI